MTFQEAEIISRSLETCLVKDTPEGDVWYAIMRGPQTPENWPLEWFVNLHDGDVRLVLGEGATEAEARLWAAGHILDTPTWHPGMGLREAERALYPVIDDAPHYARRKRKSDRILPRHKSSAH